MMTEAFAAAGDTLLSFWSWYALFKLSSVSSSASSGWEGCYF